MSVLPIFAAGLLACLLASLARVLRGPTAADRMLAAQLMGTGATALCLILAAAMDVAAFVDVALVFAVCAAVALVAFVATHPKDADR